MKGSARVSLGPVLAAAVGFAGSARAAGGDPVGIPIHDWSSRSVGAHIAGKILDNETLHHRRQP